MPGRTSTPKGFESAKISARGERWTRPVRYGQRSMLSTGGSPASAAPVSVASTPASAQNVAYQSENPPGTHSQHTGSCKTPRHWHVDLGLIGGAPHACVKPVSFVPIMRGATRCIRPPEMKEFTRIPPWLGERPMV